MTGPLSVDAPPSARICAAEGCENPLPTTGTAWHWRKYCDEHQPTPHKKKDRAPRSAPLIGQVNVGPRAQKKSKETEQARSRALLLANLLATLVQGLGQVDDAEDIRTGSRPWADAVTQLSEYEAWLRKLLLSGGETTERTMAWVAVVSATVAMLLPIGLRHGKLPPQVASLLGSFVPAGTPGEVDLSGLAPPSTSTPKHAAQDGVAA
jgi:hypothetical protein